MTAKSLHLLETSNPDPPLVLVAQLGRLDVHIVSHNPISGQAPHGELVIEGHGGSIGAVRQRGVVPVVLHGPGAGVLLLPEPPEPVDLSVMEERLRRPTAITVRRIISERVTTRANPCGCLGRRDVDFMGY